MPAQIPTVMPMATGEVAILSVVRDATGNVSVECQPGLNPVGIMTDMINKLYILAQHQLANSIQVPVGVANTDKPS
jgi:hypothetical protein